MKAADSGPPFLTFIRPRLLADAEAVLGGDAGETGGAADG
jgi:hypothetical protein